MTGVGAPMLEVAGLTKRFGATVALDGVDLTVSAGEVHAVIGENGAGKSTLMSILSGGERPDGGAMRVAGRVYTPASPLDGRRNGITLIHQELSLCPHLPVWENILLGVESARRGHIDAPEGRRRARALLEHFDHPEIHVDRRVGALSLPARQVVEICRALAAQARIVLMDEPTSSFRREDIARLFALVRGLAASGVAVIYISHFLDEVREVADRYTVLRDGRSVDGGALSRASNAQLIVQMVGRPMTGFFPRRVTPAPNDVVLAVRDLAAPPVLRNATFELARGEILGVAGLVGSGRTEMLRALFGLDQNATGHVAVRGRDVAVRGTDAAHRLEQGFGYLSEDRKGEGLALPLSIADNLTATRLSAFTRRWSGGWIDRARQRDAAKQWINRLGIRARSPTQPVRALSGGNQQKVAIGRLLHQDADVLLLDEPTRGVDIGSKAQVYEIIARCALEGKAILMVSSDLPELFGLCHRLAVMSRGRLSAARPIDAWTPEGVLNAAIGGAS